METAKNVRLHIDKKFPVRVTRLYQAWTNEEDLKQWWHPMGNNLQQAITKPEVGAPIEYVFAAETGEHSFTINGKYKEATPEKKLVYTWNWKVPTATVADSDYLLTVAFNEQEGGSLLSVTQENFTDEEAVKPHRDGWEKALDELHQFLSKQ